MSVTLTHHVTFAGAACDGEGPTTADAAKVECLGCRRLLRLVPPPPAAPLKNTAPDGWYTCGLNDCPWVEDRSRRRKEHRHRMPPRAGMERALKQLAKMGATVTTDSDGRIVYRGDGFEYRLSPRLVAWATRRA